MKEQIKKVVRERYAKIVKQESSCCGTIESPCESSNSVHEISKEIGYSEQELKVMPEESNLGLGCGNPVALASLREGETVLDLGSGAGFDCFLAANKVGKSGKVIGVDMTPEMIDQARENAKKGNYENVEFRLGEIENLPIADNSVDVVISNCVIVLSPDKRKVFSEAFRVLKPGGRLLISDIVLLRQLPDFLKNSIEAYIGCVSGAISKNEYLREIKAAGFHDVKIINETSFAIEHITSSQTVSSIIDKFKIPPEKVKEIASSILSIRVLGVKPGEAS
ncbi:MAG: arsenite methyltransferase [Thermodesulfobacteriota bacterium]